MTRSSANTLRKAPVKSRSLLVEQLEPRDLMAVFLDPSFSTDGKLTADIGGGNDVAQAVATQQDGKIVVAGYSYFGSSDEDVALARYNADGSPDTTFGGGDGEVTTGFPSTSCTQRPPSPPRCVTVDNTDEEATAVAIQADGNIVVAGTIGSGDEDFVLFRYTPFGELDTTFNTTGTVRTRFGATRDFAKAIAIQSDQKILVAGYTYNGSNYDIAIARYLPTGALDTDFSNDGKLTFAPTGGNDYGMGIGVIAGKIIVGGYSHTPIGFNYFTVARYNMDGSPDTTFQNGAFFTTRSLYELDSSSNTFEPNGFILREDQSVFLVGYDSFGSGGIATLKINSDGTRDTNFNDGNILRTPIGGESAAYAGTFQKDGKLVIVGFSAQTNEDFTIARYGVAPTITTFTVPATGIEGKNIRLFGGALDNNSTAHPTEKYRWLITGPGFRRSVLAQNTNFIPPDNGTYTVTLFASDELGVTSKRTTTITVRNFRPTITRFTVPATARLNTNVRLIGAATDPAGSRDTLKYSWLITGPNGFRKVLAGPSVVWKTGFILGTYDVRLTVTDEDGGRALKIGKLKVVV